VALVDPLFRVTFIGYNRILITTTLAEISHEQAFIRFCMWAKAVHGKPVQLGVKNK
jgi:hypothetical protein